MARKDLSFKKVLEQERQRLEQVEIPVVTVSATFRQELEKRLNGETSPREEVVLSRAHYSQAVAVLSAAQKLDRTFWLFDPLNYVSTGLWPKVLFAEKLGEAAARLSLLKKLKDLTDSLVRGRLPISEAIFRPLVFAFARVKRPIIAFHYEAANILIKLGKTVLAVVTDPYIREEYLKFAQDQKLFWAVFDQPTKEELLLKAQAMGKKVDPQRVIVTGPPVDPRIVAARKTKNPQAISQRPLRLGILTGGLGANKKEIEKVVSGFFTCYQKQICHLQLIGYGGTHKDFGEMYQRIARQYGIVPAPLEEENAPFRILTVEKENIVEANEKLIKYVFPWADGLVTKPSGDMAYDGAAAGCFLLFLTPWGEWERHCRWVFEEKGIGMDLDFDHADEQLGRLSYEGWFKRAMRNALDLPPLFLQGAKNIVRTQEKLV